MNLGVSPTLKLICHCHLSSLLLCVLGGMGLHSLNSSYLWAGTCGEKESFGMRRQTHLWSSLMDATVQLFVNELCFRSPVPSSGILLMWDYSCAQVHLNIPPADRNITHCDDTNMHTWTWVWELTLSEVGWKWAGLCDSAGSSYSIRFDSNFHLRGIFWQK